MGTIMLMLISALPMITALLPFLGAYELLSAGLQQLPVILEPVADSFEFLFGTIENYAIILFS